MRRAVAIIQARMGSTRLPGKVLLDLAGESMLARVVRRAQRIAGIAEVVVATSDLPEEEPLLRHAATLGVRAVRGPADDVLARYRLAVEATRAEAVMRITSDCPLLSPLVSGLVLTEYLLHDGDYDYVSNTMARSWPRGLDTEVIAAEALLAADREAVKPDEREHVTPFIWRQPQRFRCQAVVDRPIRSGLRWTVDQPEDLELVRRIYGAFAGDDRFEYPDVLALLAANPGWSALNAHVEQKRA
jgi:spore coat polysaccharide biosynthesis protein SpsF